MDKLQGLRDPLERVTVDDDSLDVRLICVSTGGRVLAQPTMRCTPIRYISACVRRRILLPCRYRGHPRVWADLDPGPGRPFFALPPLWHTRAAAGAILHD
jgi:hypothetical protein